MEDMGEFTGVPTAGFAQNILSIIRGKIKNTSLGLGLMAADMMN